MKAGILNNSGFLIPKASLNEEISRKIKRDLNVSPHSTFGNFQVNSFRVYSETKEYFIVPIYYAVNELNITPEEVDFPDKKNINENIKDSLILRDNQKECFDNSFSQTEKNYGGGIIQLETGMGKCLARDTEVIMFDGSLKKVQDLKRGELLMGDDNSPRTTLTMTKGHGKLFSFKNENGDKTIVNKDHILVLKNIFNQPIITNQKTVVWWENNTLQKEKCNCKEEADALAIRVRNSHQLYSEISVGDYLKTSKAFRNTFKAYRACGIEYSQKHIVFNDYTIYLQHGIPEDIKINSVKIRTSFVFYILHSVYIFDEYSGYWKFSDNHKPSLSFENDFFNLSHSLGFKVKSKMVKASICCSYNISPKYHGRGEYFGFTLDNNKRFLFKDYTVSHNTVLSIKLILKSKLKTLIIVNKIELMKQWRNEIEKWIPTAKVGIIQGNKFEVEHCDIVIGMLQTISIKKEITNKMFDFCSMCIIDEVHNVSSEVFSQVMLKVRPNYIYGLTATLERKDRLEKVIKWFVGDSLYDTNKNKQLKQTTDIYSLEYYGKSSVEKTLKDGTAAVSSMLSNIAIDNERSCMITTIIYKLLKEPERNILVVSDRISQLRFLNKKLGNETSGLFIGGMKSEELEISKTKRVLLGTYALVSEGFNHPKLNCLIFATPRSSIIQAIGRIYRKSHENITPVIIDIFDNFSIFKAQHYRRKNIYKKSIKDCCIFTSKMENFGETKTNTEDLTEELSNCCLIDDD